MEIWMKRTEKDSTFRSLCCYLVLSCVWGKGWGMNGLFPSSYSLFKFRKLNQSISASVQGTLRRGNEHIAQSIALGMMKR